jgi:hypothetical protein
MKDRNGNPISVPREAASFIRMLGGRRFSASDRASFSRLFAQYLSRSFGDVGFDRIIAIYEATDAMAAKGFRLHEADLNAFGILLRLLR